jgi:hypothetical protein
MEKNENNINGCLDNLKKLENDYKTAMQDLDINQISFLRHKIKQQKEKLRTYKKSQS